MDVFALKGAPLALSPERILRALDVERAFWAVHHQQDIANAEALQLDCARSHGESDGNHSELSLCERSRSSSLLHAATAGARVLRSVGMG